MEISNKIPNINCMVINNKNIMKNMIMSYIISLEVNYRIFFLKENHLGDVCFLT